MKCVEMIKCRLRFLYLLSIVFLLATACKDDETLGKNEYVNRWILENMEFYYLWNDDIPTKPDKSQLPDVFFSSILSDQDRFSWIQDNYEELLNSLQGINKEAGYEFVLYRESPSNENVIAHVVYIKAGSPASLKDLLRGDVITHINGTQMTLNNYQELLSQVSENHSIKYSRYNFSTELFEDKGTLSMTTIEFAENPNFMRQIIEVGGKKIGYYVYNFFATGPTDASSQYNNEMDAIFAEFKTAGITDLIIDLRFNSGGAESATLNLASLIGTGVTSSDVFTIREYNDQVEEAILDDPDLGEDFLVRKFINKSQNIGSMLTGNRVYILTRSRTASASELLINGLKPYMEVFIIGDTTVGKNVGSVSLYKENDPRNKWGMQPVVVKSYNKLNQSNYSEGFIPDVANNDNDLVIYPLGDPNENLLSLAVAEITGVGGRIGMPDRKTRGKMLGTSMDRKHWKFDLVIDDDRVKKLFQKDPE